jgi:hypothetical protein
MLIGRTPMRNIGALGVDRLSEEFDGTDMVASDEDSACLFYSFLDEGEWKGRLGEIAAWLLLAVVRIEVQMATRFTHSIA